MVDGIIMVVICCWSASGYRRSQRYLSCKDHAAHISRESETRHLIGAFTIFKDFFGVWVWSFFFSCMAAALMRAGTALKARAKS